MDHQRADMAEFVLTDGETIKTTEAPSFADFPKNCGFDVDFSLPRDYPTVSATSPTGGYEDEAKGTSLSRVSQSLKS